MIRYKKIHEIAETQLGQEVSTLFSRQEGQAGQSWEKGEFGLWAVVNCTERVSVLKLRKASRPQMQGNGNPLEATPKKNHRKKKEIVQAALKKAEI